MQGFFREIDKEYADYFASQEKPGDRSIKSFVATYNRNELKISNIGLRQDILDRVIAKHKEIWGNLHELKFLD